MSSVQAVGSQDINSRKTNTKESEKSPLKTGAAIGAGTAVGINGLQQFATKNGRESWSCLMEFARRSGAGRGTIAASVAIGFAIIAGAGALIGLGAGAIVKAVNKHGSNRQNTADTQDKTSDEAKTLDKEA